MRPKTNSHIERTIVVEDGHAERCHTRGVEVLKCLQM